MLLYFYKLEMKILKYWKLKIFVTIQHCKNSATQYPGSILLFTLFLSCFDLPNVDLMNGLESFPREYTSEQSHCGTPDIDSFIVSVLWCYPLVLFPSLSKLLLLCRIWTQYLCTSYWRFGLTLPKCSLISSGNSK